MHSRPAAGEIALALVFASVGLVCISGAGRLPFWEGFAPNSGFLPFFYGLLLAGLAIAVLVSGYFGGGLKEDGEPLGKPLLLLGALTVTVAGVELAGFGVSVFLLLLFLFIAVERLPAIRSFIVAFATTAALLLIFKTWLGVPLPAGPWGI